MKQLTTLIIATLVVGTVLMGCDSKPTPQTAEDRAMSEGRREVGEPVAPPGPPNARMVPDETQTKPPDDE
ncbi:MAG: hypothetical protein IIB99_06940 [Planctomycetes bacterium]|nr:hypothetical protein [Planctomycetota bacterium]